MWMQSFQRMWRATPRASVVQLGASVSRPRAWWQPHLPDGGQTTHDGYDIFFGVCRPSVQQGPQPVVPKDTFSRRPASPAHATLIESASLFVVTVAKRALSRLPTAKPCHPDDDTVSISDSSIPDDSVAQQAEVSRIVAEHNLSDTQAQALAVQLRTRTACVEVGMQRSGMKKLLEACERAQPGENSLRDAISCALYRLETSRALSDSIVGTRQ
jgi:hypothetical protein